MKSITLLVVLSLFSISDVLAASITGTVTDCSGNPIAGVNITIQGTALGTSTDTNGNYTFSSLAAGQTYTLVATFVGYPTEEYIVEVPLDQTYTQDIIMRSPSVTVSGNTTICSGETATITFEFTGTPNYQFELSKNGTPITTQTSTTDNYTYDVSPTSDAIYTVTSLQDDNCTGNRLYGSANITVNPIPSVNSQSNITANPGETIGPIDFTTSPTGGSIDWVNDNTAIGLASSGTGDIAAYNAPDNTTGANIVGNINVNATLNGCTSSTSESFSIAIAPDPYVVINTNDTGIGSLRWCINNANASSGETITFAISGSGPHIIQPLSALPNISQPVEIDGYSQPGSAKNTLNDANDANIEIVIDGSNLGPGDNGLVVNANNTTISGLSIINYQGGSAISISNVSNVNIQGNYLGVEPDGVTGAPNGNYGVELLNSDICTIGGAATEFHNIISSNISDEIMIQGSASIDNSILGNLIGTDNTGNAALNNSSTGIYIHSGANNNTIGGINTGEKNTIGFSDNHNILLDGSGTTQNTIRGNAIFCSVNDNNIFLGNSANNNKTAPTIDYVHPDSISGTAQANDIIDIYWDNSGCANQGASQYATTVTADGSGFWYYNTSGTFNTGDDIVALATDGNGNSSAFSNQSQIPFAITNGSLAVDNSYVDVTFSGGAWGDASTTNPLNASDFTIDLTLNGSPEVNDVTVTNATQTDGSALTGGETVVRLTLDIDGFPTGVEEMEVKPASSAIFDEGGVEMGTDQTTGLLTLNATPVITNTTTNFSMCSGETTNISVSIDQSGTINWSTTASSANLTGFSANGTANPIGETIDNSGDTYETVTYTVIPTNDDGLEGEPKDFEVEVIPLPDVVASPDSTGICSGTQLNIALSSNTSPITVFNWTSTTPSGISGNTNNGGETIRDQLTNTTTSDGLVTYTITPTLDGCAGNALDVDVVVKPETTTQFTSIDQTVCNEQTDIQLDIELEGSDPWEITLTDGVTDYNEPNATFSPFTFENLNLPNETNTFSIKEAYKIYGGLNCPMNITGDNVTVTRAPEVSATLESSDTTICENTNSIDIPVSFTGVGPWDLDFDYGGVVSSQTYSSNSGVITITPTSGTKQLSLISVSDQSLPSCNSTTNGTINITQITAPTATLSLANGSNSKTICNGDEVELQISLTGTAPWDVELSNGTTNEVLSIDASPFTVTKTINSNEDVIYDLNYVKTTNPECIGTVSGAVTLNINPLPGQPATTAISGAATVCQGATQEIYSTTSIDNADEYVWSLSDGLNFSAGSATNETTIQVDVSDNISTASITVAGKNTCGTGPESNPFDISVGSKANDPGSITGPDQVCQGTSDANYSIPAINNADGYVWYLDYTDDRTGTQLETTQPEVNINIPADFEGMTLSVEGYNACDTSSNMSTMEIGTLRIPDQAGELDGPREVCERETFTVNVSGIPEATEYVWQLPADITPANGSNTTSSNSIALVAPATSNIYSINVLGKNSCGEGLRAENALRTRIQSAPSVDIEANSSTYLGQKTPFTAINNTPEQEVIRLDWDLGDGTTDFGQEISHKYENGGFFTVILEAINDVQCSDTATMEIEVIDDVPVHIMNVITPNGDTKNDELTIDGADLFPNNEVILLNRMGVEIARFKNYNNDWNSRYNGSPLKPGNYVCIFKIAGTDIVKKQTISVLKE